MQPIARTFSGVALGAAAAAVAVVLWLPDSEVPRQAAVGPVAGGGRDASGDLRPAPRPGSSGVVLLRGDERGAGRDVPVADALRPGEPPPAGAEPEGFAAAHRDARTGSGGGAGRFPELTLFDGEPGYPFVEARWEDGTLMYRGQATPNDEGEWARHGRWESWYADGGREELGEYWQGAEHGDWEWWYANGNRMARGRFVRGERQGDWVFWAESGALAMTGSYDRDGRATGVWTYYHENGRKASEGTMVDDEPEGRWTSWNENGSVNLERSGVYRRGERIAP